MQWSKEAMYRNECQFDSFGKKLMRNYARDWYRARQWRSTKEIAISELPVGIQPERLYTDRHESEEKFFFYDLGHPIGIENDALARAICALPSRKRQIVLLSYFCGLTDKQIGVKMNRVRSAIQASRTRALKEMREMLEKEN